jgi:hypothetical protein
MTRVCSGRVGVVATEFRGRFLLLNELLIEFFDVNIVWIS